MNNPDPCLYIISGAGLSAASGIPTFRTGDDALWEGYSAEEVCYLPNFKKNYEIVWDFYNARFEQYNACEPNLAHEIMVELENEFPGRVQHITTNIDLLLERAGAKKVHHVHGRMDQIIRGYDHKSQIGTHIQSISGKVFLDQYKNEVVKPNVVFFGEAYLHTNLGPETLYTQMHNMLDKIKSNDVVVVVGASNQVVPFHILLCGCPAYKININPYEDDDESAFAMLNYFTEQFRTRAPAGMKQAAPRIRELMSKTL